MKPFDYVLPASLGDAQGAARSRAGALLKGGGLDLLDQMKGGLIAPEALVNLEGVAALRGIHVAADAVTVGALTTLQQLADHPQVRRQFPALARAAGEAATPQVRNQATVAGNLCQRPRCWFFRNWALPCLKKGGDHCFAQEGDNQYHAIFHNAPCAYVHPSNVAPALVAFGATVVIAGAKERSVPVEQFFVPPDHNVLKETVLEPGEVITQVRIPVAPWKSAYQEVRERQSFDWPLVSASAALQLAGNRVTQARLVLGAVAPIPWRVPAAEKILTGQPLTEALARKAADAAVADARPLAENAYKVQLAKVILRRTILEAAGIRS
jgi:xanthine dehydrogenase YagS FAD-binding subunit